MRLLKTSKRLSRQRMMNSRNRLEIVCVVCELARLPRRRRRFRARLLLYGASSTSPVIFFPIEDVLCAIFLFFRANSVIIEKAPDNPRYFDQIKFWIMPLRPGFIGKAAGWSNDQTAKILGLIWAVSDLHIACCLALSKKEILQLYAVRSGRIVFFFASVRRELL